MGQVYFFSKFLSRQWWYVTPIQPSAAKREGIENVEEILKFDSMVGMQAGGLSIHGE